MLVETIARAIARAEGFFVADSLPQRANNPGALTLGDVGFGTIADKTVFGSLAAGWEALHRQVALMLSGASAYYNPQMTLAQVAVIYTGGDNPTRWAQTVAGALGVTPATTLGELGGAQSVEAEPELANLVLLGAVAILFLLALRD